MHQASSVTSTTENDHYYRTWAAKHNAKGVVLLVHGLGEHCQRYHALGSALSEAGYTLCSMDLPCHGLSQGKRGHIDTFDVFQNAVLTLHSRIKIAHPDTPIFLLGHSMGGLIATRLLLNHQTLFSGALLSAAAIQNPQPVPQWQAAILNTLARLLPTLPVFKLDASALSRDPKVIAAYMADPLVSKKMLSAKFLVELNDAMNMCQTEAQKIALPLLIMHGSADAVTALAGSQLIYDLASSKDKTLRIYDGLYHEIFNEPEGESIYQEVVAWLELH